MEKIIEKVKQANSIALFTHCNADLDAYGSVGAMYHCLKSQGKTVCIFLCEEIKRKFDFLQLENIFTEPTEQDFDLAISLDASTLDRLEQYSTFFKKFDNVLIDHHFGGEKYYSLGYVDPQAPATCDILFDMFKKFDTSITPVMATCMYMGIMGDTGCLMHDNTTPQTFKKVADLLELGADRDSVKQVLMSKTLAEVKVYESIIKTLQIDDNIASAVLSKKDKKALGIEESIETSDISNLLLSIEGIKISALIKQSTKNIWRVSLRAKKGFDLASLCRQFGGGGHKQAAGYTAVGNLAFIKKQLLENLKKLKEEK